MNRSSVGQRVYDAVTDLVATDRTAHRITIAEVTGLKLSVVDDHLKRMRGDGRLKLIERGKYIPIPMAREDRAVTHTILPDLTVKLEIGDEVLHLTMRESRNMAIALSGVVYMFGMIPQR